MIAWLIAAAFRAVLIGSDIGNQSSNHSVFCAVLIDLLAAGNFRIADCARFFSVFT